MIDKLKKEITTLAEKSAKAEKPLDAMQFSQAALNLAHAAATLYTIKG